ncbi:ribosomal maturation YjgA family protein [Capnocytophaga cynodegmi]|uniref:ribosomal maturation YjgA family protein n=1 Tax=Capnocytophaga cynodegmi TaxID=28189 RepID=UPI003859AB65
MKFQFNKKYFLQAVSLFLIEVLIATIFRKIYFLRAYVGDILVVMLIYTFVLSFLKVKNKDKLLVGIFLFAVAIEILQFFKIADLLGFSKRSIGYILMGNYFSWEDIICYAVGCILLKIFNSK